MPSRSLKALLRLPVLLYRVGAGRLLGHRFLLLRHRGRRSGRLYATVLEVVAWRADEREAVVMSGFGPKAGWYRNVTEGHAVEVRIASLRFEPVVRMLEQAEAADVMRDYERRNRIAAPIARRVLSRLAGFRYDGSEAARLRLVQALPLIAFRSADDSS